MDTDFIRESAHYAGWDITELKDGTVFCGFSDWHLNIESDLFKEVMYPLLLQRAIEGCMMQFTEIDVYWLASWGWSYDIKMYVDDTLYNHESYYETSDKAKESALHYIYEQETK